MPDKNAHNVADVLALTDRLMQRNRKGNAPAPSSRQSVAPDAKKKNASRPLEPDKRTLLPPAPVSKEEPAETPPSTPSASPSWWDDLDQLSGDTQSSGFGDTQTEGNTVVPSIAPSISGDTVAWSDEELEALKNARALFAENPTDLPVPPVPIAPVATDLIPDFDTALLEARTTRHTEFLPEDDGSPTVSSETTTATYELPSSNEQTVAATEPAIEAISVPGSLEEDWEDLTETPEWDESDVSLSDSEELATIPAFKIPGLEEESDLLQNSPFPEEGVPVQQPSRPPESMLPGDALPASRFLAETAGSPIPVSPAHFDQNSLHPVSDALSRYIGELLDLVAALEYEGIEPVAAMPSAPVPAPAEVLEPEEEYDDEFPVLTDIVDNISQIM
jgi:hypothetical protein